MDAAGVFVPGALVTVDAATGADRRSLIPAGLGTAMSWSPDATRLRGTGARRPDGTFHDWWTGVTGPGGVEIIPGQSDWLPDNRVAAVVDGAVYAHHLDQSDSTELVGGVPAGYAIADVSPDGQTALLFDSSATGGTTFGTVYSPAFRFMNLVTGALRPVGEQADLGMRFRDGSTARPPAHPMVPVYRVAGGDRYATAVEVSRSVMSPPAVVIASGRDFPDALTAGVVAGVHNAPLLLTEPDRLPPVVAADIARLHPPETIVVGGPLAVSDQVMAQLPNPRRIAGADRYGTAAAVAAEVGGDRAIVTSGADFADAVLASPVAVGTRMPIVLTEPGHLPGVSATALAGRTATFVVGGPLAVSDAVMARLPTPTRIAGRDRYDTAVAVAIWNAPLSGQIGTLVLATGEQFADALVAFSLCAPSRTPLLLVPSSPAPQVRTAADFAAAIRPYVTAIYLLGGPSAVDDTVAQTVALAGY